MAKEPKLTDKLRWAKEYNSDPFYRYVFKPWIKKQLRGCMAELVTCDIDQVKEVRGMAKILAKIDDFAEDKIEFYQAELELEKVREPEGEIENKQEG